MPQVSCQVLLYWKGHHVRWISLLYNSLNPVCNAVEKEQIVKDYSMMDIYTVQAK